MKKNRWMLIVFLFFSLLLIGSKQVKALSGIETIPSLTQKQTALKKKQFGSLPNLKEFSLDSQGTGIVAYNFGKSMEDIKALNGDEQAAKEMILYESGATGYSVIGDVTDKIQVGDLGDLFSTSSNDLAEHHVKLTVSAEDSGTGKELSTDVIIYTGKVAKPTTFRELDTALQSTDVAIVDVQNSMSNSTNISPGWLSQNKKDFVLLGNGYSVDFYNASYAWGDSYSSNKIHKPVVDNIDMYGTNYFGPVTMYNLIALGASITYRNVNYLGSQITACFQATIRFAGKNNIQSVYPGYKSYDGTNRTNTNGQGQAGLESHTLVFEDNTDTTISSQDGDGVILGSWYSNWDPVQSIQPSMKVGKNANVVVKTTGNGNGESLYYQVTEYAQKIPSVINIQRNGRIDIDKGGKLTTETGENTNRILVRLGYNSTVPAEWHTTINLGEDSQFIGNINGPIASTSVAGFILSQNSQINIGKNSKMDVNSKNMTTGLPLFQLGNNSQVNVAESGTLTVNKNGGNGSILYLGANSLFNVSDEGSVKFVSDGEDKSTNPMIYGADKSKFLIGERGIFTSQIKNGTGVRTMLDFATGANFQFANARRVDLDVRGNPNAFLIGMDSGSFLADIQAVEAWSKDDASKEKPTYNWSPMYGMNIGYKDDDVTKVTGNSLTYKMRDDFIQHYNTKNLSRVYFDYIPDVHLGFDELSDNPDLSSSQVFKGVVNQGSSVAFYKVVNEKDPSKDVLLPHATVASPVEGEDKKYHLVTKNETYQFDVPSDMKLVAGDKIKAYGFLNGKSDSVINVVQDKTPPTAKGKTYYASINGTAPDAESLVQDVADTNPNNTGFTYQYNTENSLDKIQSLMSELGEHAIKVDVSDEAGNTATIDTALTVVESDSRIKADDVSIKYKDLRNMSKKEIENYILSKGNISAYKLLNGQKVDLTKYVTIKDLGGLDDTENIKTTPYTVSLVVPAKDAGEGIYDDIVGTLNVPVTDIDSVLTISFVNEADKVLDHYTTTIKALVGDTIDLTKDRTIKDKQDELEAKGYLIGDGPKDASVFHVTDTDMVIVYHVEGTVMFQSVPSTLDFGKIKYTASQKRVEKPTYDKDLVVSDIRADVANGWSIYAQISSPLKTEDGKILEDVLHYVSNGNDKVLSDSLQPIFSHKDGKSGVYDISSEWSDKPKSDGIKLEIGSSGDIFTGSYTGEITWKIMEGQP